MITKVTVLPRRAVESVIKGTLVIPQKHIIISIYSAPKEILMTEENVKKLGSKCLGGLSLLFSDIESSYFEKVSKMKNANIVSGMVLFSKEQAIKIKNLVDKHKNSEEDITLIVHCDAGVCRSGAVGCWAVDYLGLDYKEFRLNHPFIFPNSTVYRTLLDVCDMTYKHDPKDVVDGGIVIINDGEIIKKSGLIPVGEI